MTESTVSFDALGRAFLSRTFCSVLSEERGVASVLFSHLPFGRRLFWMTIVEQLSIGRVWQEEGERNGVAFWFSNGTDPSLQIPLRMTYTTRPSQDLLDQ
uniref:DUF4338 domain-containing protein n=2 Tax=Heterorhabditis bacteriophora TaxID=37862 RepID=A0A1I7WC69_HETBA